MAHYLLSAPSVSMFVHLPLLRQRVSEQSWQKWSQEKTQQPWRREEPCKQTVNMESERLWLERQWVKIRESHKPRLFIYIHMSLQSSGDIMSPICHPEAMEPFDAPTCQWIVKKYKEAGTRLAIITQ